MLKLLDVLQECVMAWLGNWTDIKKGLSKNSESLSNLELLGKLIMWMMVSLNNASMSSTAIEIYIHLYSGVSWIATQNWFRGLAIFAPMHDSS